MAARMASTTGTAGSASVVAIVDNLRAHIGDRMVARRSAVSHRAPAQNPTTLLRP
jgi:hypothetical protein